MTRGTGRWVLTADAEQRLSDTIRSEAAWRRPPEYRASIAYRAWERARADLNPRRESVDAISCSFQSGDPIDNLAPHAWIGRNDSEAEATPESLEGAIREARVALRDAWIAEGGRVRRVAP